MFLSFQSHHKFNIKNTTKSAPRMKLAKKKKKKKEKKKEKKKKKKLFLHNIRNFRGI